MTIAVLVSITLLPALLGFAGHRMARANRVLAWRLRRRPEGQSTMSVRWAAFVTKRPAMVLAGGVIGLIAIAGPATHLELGLPDAGSDPESSTERRAYDLLADGFGPGFNGPLTIVVDAPGLTKEQQAEVATSYGRRPAVVPRGRGCRAARTEPGRQHHHPVGDARQQSGIE